MDARKHRKYTPSEDFASPNISQEFLMASLVIDAHEGSNTVFFDIPWAYLHEYMPKGKTMFLKLGGNFVDIIFYFNP